MSWAVKIPSFGGIRVEWVDGERYVSAMPNQFGRIVSVSHHGLGCCWTEINLAAKCARDTFRARGVTRFGDKRSSLRHDFCSEMADQLTSGLVVPEMYGGAA